MDPTQVRRGDPAALSALLKEIAATSAPADAWQSFIAPGEVIGRFEMARELGRGGFSVVFEARDRELGRRVAFKAVRPGTASLGAAQLEREAEAIARLSHPNLVTLYDAGRCDRGPYLVLELLHGLTLEQRLEQGPIPLPEALRIAREVAAGLAYAHGEGVVHRDLKPSNVFLCERGPVKVLDFGMAHAFGQSRVTGGTPAFMAPEQWRGAPEDERTDVFAFGVILYRMLAGELPFPDGGKGLETAQPAPELEVPDAAPLGPLVARMLEKDPVKRPRHGGELLAELEAAAPPGTGASSSGLTTGGLVRRRPRAWPRLLALAVTAAVLGGVVAALVVRRPAAQAEAMPSVAVLPFASLSSTKDDEAFAEGIHGELLTQLAKMSGLRVIARSSVQQFRAEPRDLRAIAADLDVSTIVEGKLQRAGDRVRISVQLVDPRRGQEIWAERFDRDLADVFAIQSEVALEIARALGTKLTASERRLVERPPTWDREAHDLFRRGVYYWQRSVGVESDNQMAEQLLEKAVARDGSFALAHAWLAMVRSEWKHDCPSARRHADRALALEPDLPQAHAARGHIHYFCERGQVAAAIREYQEAVRGAPGDAVARVFLGSLRTSAGQLEEGLADLRVGLALDPRSFLVSVDVAQEMSRARHFDLAERVCERARELNPGDVHALALCALIPFWRGGDLGPGRRALEVLPHELPNGGDGAWSLSQLLALFPEQALEFVAAGRVQEPFSKAPLIPRSFVAGVALSSLAQADRARAAFAQALPALAARARESPDDPLARLFLGRAYAGVGRDQEAMREARRAIDLAPQEGLRTSWLRFLAEVAAAAGRDDEALEALADALRRPDGLITPASVKVDPRYAPLRGNPRFEALVGGPAAAPAR